MRGLEVLHSLAPMTTEEFEDFAESALVEDTIHPSVTLLDDSLLEKCRYDLVPGCDTGGLKRLSDLRNVGNRVQCYQVHCNLLSFRARVVPILQICI